MLTSEQSTMNTYEVGSDEREEAKEFFLNQRNAITNSIMKLSEKLMEYVNGNLSQTRVSLSDHLSGDSDSKDISNMSLSQVNEFESHLSSSSDSYL